MSIFIPSPEIFDFFLSQWWVMMVHMKYCKHPAAVSTCQQRPGQWMQREAEWRNRHNSHWSAAINLCTPAPPPHQLSRIRLQDIRRRQRQDYSRCAQWGTNTEIQLQIFWLSLKCRPPASAARGACPPTLSSRRHCSQNRNPWADCNKIPHNWLRPWEDTLNQIWYKSIHWGLMGIWVKYNV